MRRPIEPVITGEAIQRASSPGLGAKASLHLEALGQGPYKALAPYLYVEVDERCHYKPTRWLVDCQLEQADDKRTQWNAVSSHASREEAAEVAVAFVRVALVLLMASLRTGELQLTPGMRRQAAALGELEFDLEYARLDDAFKQAEQVAKKAFADDVPGWRLADNIQREARGNRDAYAREFIARFHIAHKWTKYLP